MNSDTEMTATEAALLANPEWVAAIKKGIAEAHAGLARPADFGDLEPGDD